MAITGHDTAAGPDPPRDPVLDRAYAAGASEEPPARLDAAILAAARREVGARPRRLGSVLRAWRTPVALAAVLVLSVTVVLLLREEGAERLDEAPPPAAAPSPPAASAPRADEARTANDARTAQPAAPRAKAEAASRAAPEGEAVSRLRDAPAPPPAQAEKDRNRKEQASPEVKREAPQALEAPRPAPRPFAEPPAAPTETRRAQPETPPQTDALAKQAEAGAAAQARAMERAEGEQQAAKRAPAPPAAAASPDAAAAAGVMGPPPAKLMGAPENKARMEPRDDAAVGSRPVWQAYANQPPEKWLARVEELFRAGRDAEAREMLAEFRKRFPQHPVPPALNR